MKAYLLFIVTLVGSLLFVGCKVNEEKLADLRAVRDAGNTALVAFEAELAELKVALDELPPGEDRDRVVNAVGKLEAKAEFLRQKLSLIDAGIAVVERGEVDPELIKEVGLIPSVGGYLAAGLAIFAYIQKRRQAGGLEPYKRAFEEVRNALRDSAPQLVEPRAESPSQKGDSLKFNVGLSPDTQALLKGTEPISK